MFALMYMLNLFWFAKMVWGLVKGMGIDQMIKNTERTIDDDFDSDDDTAAVVYDKKGK